MELDFVISENPLLQVHGSQAIDASRPIDNVLR